MRNDGQVEVARTLLGVLHGPITEELTMKSTRNAPQFVGISSSQLSKVTGGTGSPRRRKSENPLPRKSENPLPGKSESPLPGKSENPLHER